MVIEEESYFLQNIGFFLRGVSIMLLWFDQNFPYIPNDLEYVKELSLYLFFIYRSHWHTFMKIFFLRYKNFTSLVKIAKTVMQKTSICTSPVCSTVIVGEAERVGFSFITCDLSETRFIIGSGNFEWYWTHTNLYIKCTLFLN